jgi:hypothetical protein
LHRQVGEDLVAKARWFAVALVALVGVGCGGSSGQRVAVEATPVAMRRAAQSTLAKGTSKVDFTIRMTIQAHDVAMTGTGAMDPSNKRFQMSFDAKDLFAQAAGSSGGTPPPAVASAFDQPIEVILDHAVMYMHFPALASLAGGGKEWLKFDLTAANKNVGSLLGSGSGGAFGSDPSSFLQFLEGAGKVSQVGQEDVRGVSTTHFSGSYTLKDALAALPADQRDKAEQAIKNLNLSTDAETQDIPFDAWIDADGLVRRIETRFDFSKLAPPGAATPLGSMDETLEFFDFGSPVDIQLPSDDQVQDLSALVANASSRFSSVASSIN